MTAPLFSVRGLRVSLPDPRRKNLLGQRPMVEILRGIDLDIEEGTVVGIVGESGSGKSTLGRTLVRLIAPAGGSIRFAGEDITRHSENALRPLRRGMQVIFQDPLSSLNPRLTIETIVARPLRFHKVAVTSPDAKMLAAEALTMVGLPQSVARALSARAVGRAAAARRNRARHRA
jgi:peptide/nickel transport system ATP-binding protein